MPFQFLCPQGHLLEGVESQMGQQCQCPVCGMMFLVPFVGGQPQAAAPAYGAPPGYGQPPAAPPGGHGQPPGYPPPGYSAPAAEYSPAPAIAEPAAAAAPVETAAVAAPEAEDPPAEEKPTEEPKPEEDLNRIVRIPCPQGHELHTPMSMIGMDAMCPECGEQFTLNYDDSIEAREEKELKRQQREELFNKRVLQWSIGAAVFVFLGLFTIILIKLFKSDPNETTPPPDAPAASGADGAADEGAAGETEAATDDKPADDGPADDNEADAPADADDDRASSDDGQMDEE